MAGVSTILLAEVGWAVAGGDGIWQDRVRPAVPASTVDGRRLSDGQQAPVPAEPSL